MSWSNLLSVGALLVGKQFHSYAIKAGMSSDIILEGALLDLYVKCLDIKTAHEFFLSTETENVVLWNVMLVAYGLLDNLNESFKIFTQMQMEGIEPNQFTYPSILRTCSSLRAVDLGEQIHTHPFSMKPHFLHRFNSSLPEWSNYVKGCTLTTQKVKIYQE